MTADEEIEERLERISWSLLQNLASLNRAIQSLQIKNQQAGSTPKSQALPPNVIRLMPRAKT